MKNRITIVILVILLVALGSIVYVRAACTDDNAAIPDIEEKPVTTQNTASEEPSREYGDPISLTVLTKPIQKVDEELEKTEEVKKVEYPKLYTEQDAIALAQMLYGESIYVPTLYTWDGKVVSSECQNAACVWAVLNRWDPAQYDSIYEIVTRPYQYHGWKASNPVDPYWLELVYDVLDRWNREMHGETDVGRVLPSNYIYWHGDGTYNYFRNWYTGGYGYWDWSYHDPYV